MLAAAGGRTWEERLERTLPAWKGAFSLVLLAQNQVIAVRDPWGFRPLSVGRLPHGGYAVASETCALSTLGCSRHRRGPAGRDRHLAGRRDAAVTRRSPPPPRRRAARSSSCTSRAPTRCGTASNVHHVRQRLGVELARESAVDADVVIPVPDSSIPAAIGYSGVSGIPLQRRTDQEPLHRTHVHRAHPGHARARRGAEVQRPRREPGRQAGDHDRRLAGARHHRRPARQARTRRRRHRGPSADHVPADHARLPLRRRHGPRRRPDGGACSRSRRCASRSAPTASPSCRSRA